VAGHKSFRVFFSRFLLFGQRKQGARLAPGSSAGYLALGFPSSGSRHGAGCGGTCVHGARGKKAPFGRKLTVATAKRPPENKVEKYMYVNSAGQHPS